jgi:hypothetical protein
MFISDPARRRTQNSYYFILKEAVEEISAIRGVGAGAVLNPINFTAETSISLPRYKRIYHKSSIVSDQGK